MTPLSPKYIQSPPSRGGQNGECSRAKASALEYFKTHLRIIRKQRRHQHGVAGRLAAQAGASRSRVSAGWAAVPAVARARYAGRRPALPQMWPRWGLDSPRSIWPSMALLTPVAAAVCPGSSRGFCVARAGVSPSGGQGDGIGQNGWWHGKLVRYGAHRLASSHHNNPSVGLSCRAGIKGFTCVVFHPGYMRQPG